MKLCCVNGMCKGLRVDVDPAGMTIGASGGNHVVIDAPGISRHHAKIERMDDEWFLFDMNSRNGVHLNGTLVHGKSSLHSTDRIRLHGEIFVFLSSEEEEGYFARLEHHEKMKRYYKPSASPAEVMQTRKKMVFWGLILLSFVIGVGLTSLKSFLDKKAEKDIARTQKQGVVEVRKESVDDMLNGEKAESPLFSTVDYGELKVEEVERKNDEMQLKENGNSVQIVSDPPGANVFINDLECGMTPLGLQFLPEGQYKLRLSKKGFFPVKERTFKIPRKNRILTQQMKQKPGTVFIRSVPSGAVVFQGSRMLGRAPTVLAGLNEGVNTFELKLPGYKTQVHSTVVSAINAESFTAELPLDTGSLKVVSLPSGCRVKVDGVFMGKTSAVKNGGKAESSPFFLAGVLSGEREVEVEHHFGVSYKAKVNVKPGKEVFVGAAVWVIDTEVEMHDGSLIKGMFVREEKDGLLTLATTPKELRRLPGDRVGERKRLTKDEALAAMKSFFETYND